MIRIALNSVNRNRQYEIPGMYGGKLPRCIKTIHSYLTSRIIDNGNAQVVSLGVCYFTRALSVPTPTKATSSLQSVKIETVKVHNLVPYRYKVMQEFCMGVLAGVHFR